MLMRTVKGISCWKFDFERTCRDLLNVFILRCGVRMWHDIARLASVDLLCSYGCRNPCVVPALLDQTGDIYQREVAMTVDRLFVL